MAITCKTGDRIEERVPRCLSGRAVEDLIVGPLSYTFPRFGGGITMCGLLRCSETGSTAEEAERKVALGILDYPSNKDLRLSCFGLDRSNRRPGKTGGYAAFASHVSCIAGYQCDSVERHSSFKTRVRTCSKRWAPRSVHRICCFFTMRLLRT